MNIKPILVAPAFLVAAFLSSCEFNEDFCVRDGILYATCDYSSISAGIYVEPSTQHLIGYGRSVHTLSVSEPADFVTDTLEWKAPQGEYDFLLYAGKEGFDILNEKELQSCQAVAQTKEVNDKVYYSCDLPLISYNIFSDKLVYQQPTYREVKMKPLTQEVVIRLHLKGNQLDVIDSISSELGGVSLGRIFTTLQPSAGSAYISTVYNKDVSSEKLWEGSSNVLGFSETEANILRLFTKTTNNSDDIYEMDLTSYLRGIRDYKIIINLDLSVGHKLELNQPIIIERWETGEQIEVELKPV